MITLSKISQLAHVSVSTVSKAFTMSPEVNPETRELIFDIAKQHGCFKKYYRAKYPRHVVAVICPEFKSLNYSILLSTLQEHLATYGCEISVASTDFSRETEANLLEYYNQHTAVEGIIMINCGTPIASTFEIPVATIRCGKDCKGIINIQTEYYSVLEESILHFIDLGVNSFGYIGELHTARKQEYFETILSHNNIAPKDSVIQTTSERFEKGGYEAMEAVFAGGRIPRILFCAYDYMAIGAIRCIHDHGLQIPGDIAVLGMDNIRESAYLIPSLSSINTHMVEACQLAADHIMSCIMDGPTPQNIFLPSEVIFRESTRI